MPETNNSPLTPELQEQALVTLVDKNISRVQNNVTLYTKPLCTNIEEASKARDKKWNYYFLKMFKHAIKFYNKQSEGNLNYSNLDAYIEVFWGALYNNKIAYLDDKERKVIAQDTFNLMWDPDFMSIISLYKERIKFIDKESMDINDKEWLDFLENHLNNDSLTQFIKDKITIVSNLEIWEDWVEYFEEDGKQYQKHSDGKVGFQYVRELVTNKFGILVETGYHDDRWTQRDIIMLDYKMEDYRWVIKWKDFNYILFNTNTWLVFVNDKTGEDICNSTIAADNELDIKKFVEIREIEWEEYVIYSKVSHSNLVLWTWNDSKIFTINTISSLIWNNELFIDNEYKNSSTDNFPNFTYVEMYKKLAEDLTYILKDDWTLLIFNYNWDKLKKELKTDMTSLNFIDDRSLVCLLNWQFDTALHAHNWNDVRQAVIIK